MSSFTCINCRVAFADADLQRSHYKSDWHRYNLKRKVADLPPVTAENFQARVLAQRAQVNNKLSLQYCTSSYIYFNVPCVGYFFGCRFQSRRHQNLLDVRHAINTLPVRMPTQTICSLRNTKSRQSNMNRPNRRRLLFPWKQNLR